MRTTFVAVLAKVSTKRAKRDSNGIVTEEPAIAVTIEVPISQLEPRVLGDLLRCVDRELEVALVDPQQSFAPSRDGGVLTIER